MNSSITININTPTGHRKALYFKASHDWHLIDKGTTLQHWERIKHNLNAFKRVNK